MDVQKLKLLLTILCNRACALRVNFSTALCSDPFLKISMLIKERKKLVRVLYNTALSIFMLAMPFKIYQYKMVEKGCAKSTDIFIFIIQTAGF